MFLPETTTTRTPTTHTTPVHIRWMIRRDMPEVLAIEEGCFAVWAWGEEDFLAKLRQRNCIGMVAELGERVVGYMIYELEKNHLHVLNLAVHPAYQRRHIGSQMVGKLINKLAPQRRTRITLDVGEWNTDAHLFLKANAFQATHVLRGFYPDREQDAYHFEYALPGAGEMEEEITLGGEA